MSYTYITEETHTHHQRRKDAVGDWEVTSDKSSPIQHCSEKTIQKRNIEGHSIKTVTTKFLIPLPERHGRQGVQRRVKGRERGSRKKRQGRRQRKRRRQK